MAAELSRSCSIRLILSVADTRFCGADDLLLLLGMSCNGLFKGTEICEAHVLGVSASVIEVEQVEICGNAFCDEVGKVTSSGDDGGCITDVALDDDGRLALTDAA